MLANFEFYFCSPLLKFAQLLFKFIVLRTDSFVCFLATYLQRMHDLRRLVQRFLQYLYFLVLQVQFLRLLPISVPLLVQHFFSPVVDLLESFFVVLLRPFHHIF